MSYIRESAVKVWRAVKSIGGRQIPRYSRWGLYAQSIVFIGCYFCIRWWPVVPGVAIAFLALVAAIMAVRADSFTETEKAIWIVMSLALCFIEVTTIHKDRDEYTAAQANLRIKEDDARRKENESFAALLTRASDLFAQGKDVLDLSKKNLDTVTGGHSFCYIRMSLEKNGVPVYLIHDGRNHILEISVRIVDLDGFDPAGGGKFFEDPNRYQTQFGPIPTLLRGTASVLTTYPALSADTDNKRYNVFIMARNGAFTEHIRLRKNPDSHLWAEAILVVASYYDGTRGVVFREAGGVPIEALNQDREWTDAEKMPTLHIAN